MLLLKVSLGCVEFHAPSYNEDVEKLDTAQRGATKMIGGLTSMPMKKS